MFRVRRVLGLVLCSSVLALGVGLRAEPASADPIGPYAGSADGVGLSLNLFGTALAFGTTASTARANALGFKGVATGIGVASIATTVATAERTLVGTTTNGPSCATPALPAAVASVVSLGAACGSASATVDAVGAVGADSTASIAALGVSAEALGALITSLLIAPIQATLESATGPVTTTNGQLSAAIATVCTTAPAPLAVACTAATAALTSQLNALLPTAASYLTAIKAAIAASLKGVQLLTISVGDTQSKVVTTAGQVVATSTGASLSITSVGLKFLLDAIRQAVALVLTKFIVDVAAVVQATVTPLPVVGGAANAATVAGLFVNTITPVAITAVTTVVDALVAALPILNDAEPLITVVGPASTASSAIDRASGSVTTAGSASAVTITFSKALAKLVGVPQTTTVPAGQTQDIAAGTPLASKIAVGSAAPASGALDGIGLTGTKSTGIALDLFTGVSGGVLFRLSGAGALVGGVPGPLPPAPTSSTPAGELPHTGGNELFVLLGGLALAGGLVARRRVRRLTV